MKIEEIDLGSLSYPYTLSNIYLPPKKLYVMGNKEILREKIIAIVGTREPSTYGLKVAKELAYFLAKQNIITVSGLARGIDSACHIGTILGKGRTIAVVAHGLDMIYPKENTRLANEILKNGGAIVSEYKLGEKSSKEKFPKRNRIISGLANSIVIVEAKRKSGALITANFGLEQGKDIYAVPRKYL